MQHREHSRHLLAQVLEAANSVVSNRLGEIWGILALSGLGGGKCETMQVEQASSFLHQVPPLRQLARSNPARAISTFTFASACCAASNSNARASLSSALARLNRS